MSNDNTQDAAEPSLASAGSHREPVAWAVVLADGQRIYDVYGIEEEAKAIDEAVTGNHGIIPLYRSPTLTDEEREAIGEAIRLGDQWGWSETLRGLLERLG
jgi:hypothetical protein